MNIILTLALAVIIGVFWVLYRLNSDFQLTTLQRDWYDKTEKKLFVLQCQAENASVSASMLPLRKVMVCKFTVDPKLFEHAMTLSEEDRKFLSEVFTSERKDGDGRVPKQFQVTMEVSQSKSVVRFTIPDSPDFPEKVTTTYFNMPSNILDSPPSYDVLNRDSLWDVQLPNGKVIRLLFKNHPNEDYLKLIVASLGRSGFKKDDCESEIFKIPVTKHKVYPLLPGLMSYPDKAETFLKDRQSEVRVTDKGIEYQDLLSKYYEPRLSDFPQCKGYVHQEEGLWWFLQLQDYGVCEGKVLSIYDFDCDDDFYSEGWLRPPHVSGSKCDRIAQIGEIRFSETLGCSGERIWLPFSTENPLEEGQRILVRVDSMETSVSLPEVSIFMGTRRCWFGWEPFPEWILGKHSGIGQSGG